MRQTETRTEKKRARENIHEYMWLKIIKDAKGMMLRELQSIKVHEY